MKNIWKIKQLLVSNKEKIRVEITKSNFFRKSQKLLTERAPRKAAYSEHSIAIHSISKAGYVTAVLAIVRTELRAREASSFCDFWKMTFCDFTYFIIFLTKANIIFLDVLGKEYYS